MREHDLPVNVDYAQLAALGLAKQSEGEGDSDPIDDSRPIGAGGFPLDENAKLAVQATTQGK